jgi:hypothetical protein
MTSPGHNRLPHLADEVRRGQAIFRQGRRMSKEGAVIAGTALIEAKSLLAHGSWLPWLAECGVSPRTASRHMRKAREPKPQIGQVADLTFEELISIQETSRYLQQCADAVEILAKIAFRSGRFELIEEDLRTIIHIADDWNYRTKRRLRK